LPMRFHGLIRRRVIGEGVPSESHEQHCSSEFDSAIHTSVPSPG
jgi:hypothetical protein